MESVSARTLCVRVNTDNTASASEQLGEKLSAPSAFSAVVVILGSLKNARPAAEAAAYGVLEGAGQFLGSVHYVSLIVLGCTRLLPAVL
jgi:hypothetical protein